MEIFGVRFTEGEVIGLVCILLFVAACIWYMIRSTPKNGGPRWGG